MSKKCLTCANRRTVVRNVYDKAGEVIGTERVGTYMSTCRDCIYNDRVDHGTRRPPDEEFFRRYVYSVKEEAINFWDDDAPTVAQITANGATVVNINNNFIDKSVNIKDSALNRTSVSNES